MQISVYFVCAVQFLKVLHFSRNLANNNLEGHIPANISSCSALNKL